MSPQFDTSPAETLGVGSMVSGLLSLGLCWWFPFGAVLGGCGVGLGLASRLAGRNRYAPLGALFSVIGAASSMLLVWDRLLGM